MFLRTVYKPHSVHGARRHWAIISLGGTSPRRSMRPTRDWLSHRMRKHVKKTSSLPPSADGFVPTWSCSRRGLPGHPHYCRCRWSFTPPFHHHLSLTPPLGHPSPNGRGDGGEGWLFVSVALFRQVSSSRRVPRPGCYPTPCSMECGLSSTPTTQDRDRPTDLRPHYDTRNSA
jgi:hypothetical protein